MMPTYCYVNENDETDVLERIYPVSKFKRRRRFNGKWYVVSGALQQKGKKATGGYPYYSEVMGVHPAKVAEAQQQFRDAGLAEQTFNRDGDVLVTGRGHRKQLMKAIGFVDRNSYTGY